MDLDRELAKIAEMFHLWDMGYTLEAIQYVLTLPDLTDTDRVRLARVVLGRHFDPCDES